MYTGNHHEHTYASLDASSTAFATSPPIYPYQAQSQTSPTYYSPHQYHHLQTNMSTSTNVPQLSSTLPEGDEMTVDHLLDNVCRLLIHLTFLITYPNTFVHLAGPTIRARTRYQHPHGPLDPPRRSFPPNPAQRPQTGTHGPPRGDQRTRQPQGQR